MCKKKYNIAIIGAGIIGLTIAYELNKRYPKTKILLLEKEKQIALHQTGRNSGVIHSGIYYTPGSVKAKTCSMGVEKLYNFCKTHSISHKKIGKIIVTKNEQEKKYLYDLYNRGLENNISGLEILKNKKLREIEKHIDATLGIWVPSTGVVDYKDVCKKIINIITPKNVDILYNQNVQQIKLQENQIQISTQHQNFSFDFMFNCAGLHADYIANFCGVQPSIRLIPFRGEYYCLVPEKVDLVRGLIYPVPNPSFPFLGVHLTKTIDGNVEIGPNAVLSFKREGYKKTSFSLKDTTSTISFPGFWKFAAKNWRTAINEYHRSFSKKTFAKSVKQLLPVVSHKDMVFHKIGVRAQALDKNGTLVDDFCFEKSERALHIINAPSPAATASFAIAEKILKDVAKNNMLNFL